MLYELHPFENFMREQPMQHLGDRDAEEIRHCSKLIAESTKERFDRKSQILVPMLHMGSAWERAQWFKARRPRGGCSVGRLRATLFEENCDEN